MKKKILVAEDNEQNLILLRDILLYHGYEVIEARNGTEAIERAKETMPDLIIMDLQLPIVDGFKAIKALKTLPSTKEIKIIAATALAMDTDREKAIEAGADGYITKPLDTRNLPHIIKNYLKED